MFTPNVYWNRKVLRVIPRPSRALVNEARLQLTARVGLGTGIPWCSPRRTELGDIEGSRHAKISRASTITISNYWMRLSGIWRIVQIKEGVICRGRRPRWITPSKICTILHIVWKPNSIVALLFIQIISPFFKEFLHFALCFSAHQNNTTFSPGFLGHLFNNL